jgi:streptogramin lyase
MATVSRASPSASLASWGCPTLIGGNLWEVVVPNVVRYDIAANSWATIRSDLTGSDTDSMTATDGTGDLWSYRSGDVLVRYDIGTDTVTEYPSGVSASSQTRLGYDPGTNSIYFGSAFGSTFHRFDIATTTVSSLMAHPEGGLSDTFCTDYSGHIYAGDCGGANIYQYDIATNTWTMLPDAPVSGCNGSCSVHEDGWLYVEDLGNAARIALY